MWNERDVYSVYHYHSNYDSFSWMKNFGDPDWERHVFVSKVLGLTGLKLIESLILPLNTTGKYRFSLFNFFFELRRD